MMIPRKYQERAVFYKRIYLSGAPLDSVEDRIILENVCRLPYTDDMKEWFEKMEGWAIFWVGEEKSGYRVKNKGGVDKE